jgi:hypothetical protein
MLHMRNCGMQSKKSGLRTRSALFLCAGFFLIFAVVAGGQSLSTGKSQQRLAKAISMTLAQGHDAILPPHISDLLGISPDKKEIPVKQFVQMGTVVRGFEVSKPENDDVVIFVEDRPASETTFYLTSPRGTVRKILDVKAGVGYPRKPTVSDKEAFAKEKTFWLDQLAPSHR